MKEIDENILKDLIAGKARDEEQEEEKVETQITRSRKKKNDYISLFFKSNLIKERRSIYISKENFERISVLTRLTNFSMSGYIDNVIAQHLEQFETEISNTIQEQILKLKP